MAKTQIMSSSQHAVASGSLQRYRPRLPVSRAEVLGQLAVTILALVIMILYFFQPDLDFAEGTTMYLWPFSPTRIAIPFSIGYLLWLLTLCDSKCAKLEATEGGRTRMALIVLTAILAAFTLSAIELGIFFRTFKGYYYDMPAYEVGNFSVEQEWAAFIPSFVVCFLCNCYPAAIPWLPVAGIVGDCRRAFESSNKSSPAAKCPTTDFAKRPTAEARTTIGNSREQKVGSKDTSTHAQLDADRSKVTAKETDTTGSALKDWVIVSTDKNFEELRDSLKTFKREIARVHDASRESCWCEDTANWRSMYEDLYGLIQEVLGGHEES